MTKAATGAAAAVGGLAGSIAGTPLKSMKNMAGKAWEEKLKSEVQSAKEGNGFFGFGGSGINLRIHPLVQMMEIRIMEILTMDLVELRWVALNLKTKCY